MTELKVHDFPPPGERCLALYLRLSRKTDASVSIESQLENGLQEAERRGWTGPIVVYADRSGASDRMKVRKDYERLMTDIRSGAIVRVLCRDDDRLVRQPRELEDLIDVLQPRAVPVEFWAGSDLDLTTEDGRTNARIRGAIARSEVEKKSKRQRLANIHRVSVGIPLCSTRPLGYTIERGPNGFKTLLAVQKEAEAIKWAVTFLLANGTMADVAREFNRRGLRAPKNGAEYTFLSARDAVLNPYVCGRQNYRPGSILAAERKRRPMNWRGDLTVGNWEPIVSYDRWKAVVAVCGTKTSYGNNLKYWSSGMSKCAVCGSKMASGWKHTSRGGRFRTIKCHSNRCVILKAEPIEDYLSGLLVEMMTQEDFGKEEAERSSQERAELAKKREELEKELAQLTDMYVRRAIRLPQLDAGSQKINAEIDLIDELLSDTAGSAAMAERAKPITRAEWDALTVEQKRMYLQDFLPEILIFPAGSNPAPPPATYVHAYDRRGRLRPLALDEDVYWLTTVDQLRHAEAHGKPVEVEGQPYSYPNDIPPVYEALRAARDASWVGRNAPEAGWFANFGDAGRTGRPSALKDS
ncbi:recombinase family protein [Actinoplanes sp. CA-054009]